MLAGRTYMGHLSQVVSIVYRNMGEEYGPEIPRLK